MEIIAYACTQRQMNDSGITFSILITFNCQCPSIIVVILQFPARHTLFKLLFSGDGSFVFNCQCYKLGSFEICQNCVIIRYVLNVSADNICVLQILKSIEEKMMKIEDYLSNIKNEPFFYFCKKEKKIHLSLDDPNFK